MGGISELPEEIVVSIISHLEIKEAIATSVLSREWRHRWKYTTGSWRFNPLQVFHDKYASGNYFTRVKQALESHRGPFLYEIVFTSLQTLQSIFYCDEKICNLISIASTKRVQRLDLDMWRPYHELDLIIPTLSVFSNLSSLALTNVVISEETLCSFLSICPVLEHLCVTRSPALRNLIVAGDPWLKLKHLEIFDCTRLQSLEISAPNIESFDCAMLELRACIISDCSCLKSLETSGAKINSFACTRRTDNTTDVRVPLLSTLSIGLSNDDSDDLKLVKPLSYLSQIESLTLRLITENSIDLSMPDVELSNLKHLELNIVQLTRRSYLQYICFLKASPLLSSLKIKLKNCFWERLLDSEDWAEEFQCLGRANEPTKYQQCLRVVTLSGFIGYRCDVEFALHLIGMAKSLEKMVIYCGKKFTVCLTAEEERRMTVITRKRAEELRSKLPPTTDFLVL